MHILIVSPTPTDPATHGNRRRIVTVIDQLRALGHRVHGIYLAFDALKGDQEACMRARFDTLHIVTPPWMQGAPRPAPRPRRGRVYGVDDWGWPEAGAAVAHHCTRWPVDAVWVNYVWCSHVLGRVPSTVTRIIDTHDVFADRHKKLAREGLKPSFFYTSRAEENRGLARADHVIAIQDAEGAAFQARGLSGVRVIGHLQSPQVRSHRPPSNGSQNTEPLRVGYLASDNPLNQHALAELDRQLIAKSGYTGEIDWILAGPLAQTELAQRSGFRCIGPQDDLSTYYSSLDLAINPHIGGTGLKIKSVEALLYRCPLVATKDAMLGLNTVMAAQQCGDIADLIDHVLLLAQDPAARLQLMAAGDTLIEAYSAQQHRALAALLPAATKTAP